MPRESESQKLMDQVVAVPGDPIVGVLATTFELQPDFVETDLLPTIFALGSWDDRSWASRVAIERRLAELDAAVLFQAAEQYRGRARSLRVEVVPVPRAGNRVLHAKITLFVHEASVRLLVTSANLTEPGYRRNREAAVVLAASAQKPAQAPLIRACLRDLPQFLRKWWSSDADRVTRSALTLLNSWMPRDPSDADEWFVWGGGDIPIWSSFLERWPADEQVRSIHIVSPFWSRSVKDGPVDRLLAELKNRGALASGAELRLLTEARAETLRTLRPVLPESYGSFDPRPFGVTARALPVDPLPSRDDTGVEDTRPRPLHAKVVLLQGARTSLAYIGSANFSRHGWGFLVDPPSANIEAGVVLRRTGKQRELLAALLPPTSGPGVALDGAAAGSIALPEPDQPARTWPTFLHSVRLVPAQADARRLELEVEIDPATVAGNWRIELDTGGESDVAAVLLQGMASPAGVEIAAYRNVALSPEQLTRLLYTQHVNVYWWAAPDMAEFPINVDEAAREDLPLAPEAGQPGEQLLLQYYQSRINFEDMFRPPPGFDDDDERESLSKSATETDVDTSRIQSYQIREFVEALRGIRDDLRRAALGTPGAMHLALLGPVSPVSLANMVVEAVKTRARTPTAGAFQLVEISACLAGVRSCQVREQHRDRWFELVDQASKRVGEQLGLLRELAPDELGGSRSFERYEKAVRALGV